MPSELLRQNEDRAHFLNDRLCALFPQLKYGKLLWIDNPNKLQVVFDVPDISDTWDIANLTALVECGNGMIEAHDMRNVNMQLANQIAPLFQRLDATDTRIIYPGKGAQQVYGHMSAYLDHIPSLLIPSTRIKDPHKGIVGAIVDREQLSKEIEDNPNVRKVLILDDAVSTGTTLTAIRECVNRSDIHWYAGCSMIFDPLFPQERQQFPSSIEGYDEIFAGYAFFGPITPIRLFKLSSLLNGSKNHIIDQVSPYVSPPDITLFMQLLDPNLRDTLKRKKIQH